MIIKFKISERRRQGATNKFDPKLSQYWQKTYYELFKNW